MTAIQELRQAIVVELIAIDDHLRETRGRRFLEVLADMHGLTWLLSLQCSFQDIGLSEIDNKWHVLFYLQVVLMWCAKFLTGERIFITVQGQELGSPRITNCAMRQKLRGLEQAQSKRLTSDRRREYNMAVNLLFPLFVYYRFINILPALIEVYVKKAEGEGCDYVSLHKHNFGVIKSYTGKRKKFTCQVLFANSVINVLFGCN